jgi:exopolysaccharide production protein ExoQ
LSPSTATPCRDTSPHLAVRGPRRLPFWLLVGGVMALCYFAQPLNFFYTLDPGLSVDSHIRATTEGSLARQVSLLLAGVWAAVSIVVHRSQLRLDGRLAACALLFLFIVVASIGWADDPWLSARRAAALLTFAACCVGIALQVGLDRMASLVFWGSALAVGVSGGAELALGTFAPLDPAYRFAGIMHANEQGFYCGCFTLAGVSLARRARSRAGAYAVGAAIGFAFLLLTKSRVSLASVLVSLTCYYVLTSARARYWALVAATAGAIAAVPLLLVDTHGASPLLALLRLGRQEDVSTVVTLTGRTPLWQTLLQYVAERPLLGYGYGGFWTPQRLAALTQREGWVFGSAHSEYVEIALGIGVLGLAVYCATGLAALWRLVAGYWRSRAEWYAFGAALIVLVAVDMLANSVPLDPSLPMVSCLTIVAGLAVVHGPGDVALDR